MPALVCCGVSAAELKDRGEYQAALRALADQLPQVAALKFERLLQDSSLSHSEVVRVAERLTDALVRAKQPEKVLVALTFFDVPDAAFWKAQALVLQGKFREAETELRAYLNLKSGRYRDLAGLMLGQVLIGQGRENTGRKQLKLLSESQDVEVASLSRLWANESESLSGRSAATLRRLAGSDLDGRAMEFVKGAALVEAGEGREADRILRKLVKESEGNPVRLQHAIVVRLAEAWELQGRQRSAEKLLQRFINESEDSPFFDRAFAILDRVKSTEETDTLEWYGKWAAQPGATEKKYHAMYYQARNLAEAGKVEDALRGLEAFHEGGMSHPRSSEAMRLLMALHGSQHNDDRVLELAREWRSWNGTGGEDTVDFLTGMIRFSRREFSDAVALFQHSAELASDLVQKQRAIYNMGVAALLGGLPQPYSRAVVLLTENKEADSSAGNLELERALHLALLRDGAAEEALREFLKSYPDDPRWVEAQIALAEYCLLDIPPSRRDEVRMKIAQAYFRLEDYPRSRGQFEQVAEDNPDSSYAEVAQFFAARAAMFTLNAKDLDKALDHFSDVAQQGGPLAAESRRQMAMIKRMQGKESDALAVIENVLTSKPAPTGDELLSLQVEKGELLALMSKQDSKNLTDAIAVFRGVVQLPGAARYWRARAGVLLAQSLQRTDRSNEALEACTDVVDITREAAEPFTTRELAWFYRAGFLAVEILESQKKWDAAAKMADRLAQSNGVRAVEARERANRIRLEHFIWDK
ncbi:MAG: tetratricopeptide repeat protein [Verrucomicrobia bacterium]|nr:tetratricopeptide repeat protein [Verrucomicrobiota bacterium]